MLGLSKLHIPLQIIILIVGSIGVYAQQIKVIGTISNCPTQFSSKVYLQRYFLEEVIPVDSASINSDGKFEFGLDDFVEGFYVCNMKGRQVFPLVLGYGDTVIKIESEFNAFTGGNGRILNSIENELNAIILSMSLGHKAVEDSLRKLNAGLSNVDSLYYRKKMGNRRLINEERQELNRRLDEIKRLYPCTYTGRVIANVYKHPTRLDRTEWTRKYDGDWSFNHWHFFDFMDFNDDGTWGHPAIRFEIGHYLRQFIGKNSHDFIESADMIMSKVSESSPAYSYLVEKLLYTFALEDQGARALSHVEEKYYSGCADQLIQSFRETAEFRKGLPLYATIPDITLPNEHGNELILLDLCSTGKLNLIMFWKSTCPHCVEEMRNIRSLYENYEEKGLQIIAISVDENKEDWKAAIKSEKMNWVNLGDMEGYDSPSIKEFKVLATPTILLADQSGRLLAKDVTGNRLRNTIARLLQ